MPRDYSIKKVLVIGSGPIVIGQAAEFDYAGTQACRAFKEEGISVVLVNSNPATIMTDNEMADSIYIEPLTTETVTRIIAKERPDSILSGLGGQTGLNLCMQLAKDGTLAKYNVRLLGASPETIDKAEDRLLFKQTMELAGQPCVPSHVVNRTDDALEFAESIGYPVIVRPAFTLGGSGGGIATTKEELNEIAANGISLSPINQILVEKSIAGWKEIEFEVMRDSAGNAITVCSMENFDPVGVHTGDSIVIAPTVTLADREYQMLRSAALKIVETLGVVGGCNCQFALNPNSFDYAVIEVNPRVSRSSALASKATGYPIAKVATKIAIGYTLDEIPNAVTRKTYASFEPALDYVAVKLPKWPFDKFVYAKKELGTQMKSTGEVMAIADSFEAALLKAIRGADIGTQTLDLPLVKRFSDDKLVRLITKPTDIRVFAIYEALKRGMSIELIHDISSIDIWFLSKLDKVRQYMESLSKQPPNQEMYEYGKVLGLPDSVIGYQGAKLKPCYKMVDTCSGEFEAVTPYFYANFERSGSGAVNEALIDIDNGQPKVIVLGSGPIRIGQGIEFDYGCVHAVRSLKAQGFRTVLINNNPETLSTDFDTVDRLYFEPITVEDVLNIIEIEKPYGVVVAFGGGTAIKVGRELSRYGVNIIGTSADGIDKAEDRERFDAMLEELQLARPQGYGVSEIEQAVILAEEIGYPVLLRPSYVLGGQNMIVAFGEEDVREYMDIILSAGQDNPVLIDKYISGIEAEVDAICDGENILIPGVMEHIERTGIHSGDSIAMYPASNILPHIIEELTSITEKICRGLDARGLVNIQYIVKGDEIFIIEVNPRASRTVPYMSKVTGVPMCDLAIRASLGAKLTEMGYGTGLRPVPNYVSVKVPVFSFEKLTDLDTLLGPEMKSTGEVLGIGSCVEEALYKGLVSAGYKMRKDGGVFVTVKDSDKPEIAKVMRSFYEAGFELYATKGTAEVLEQSGMTVTVVDKIHESDNNPLRLLNSGKVNYIISTSKKGRDPALDDVKIRRRAVLLGIPCLTAIDTAQALIGSVLGKFSQSNTVLVDINSLRL